MRKAYIAGNWKMNNSLQESINLAKALVEKLKGCESKIMIAPCFTQLKEISNILSGSNILLGAQNISFAEKGAHTGEISPSMLKEAGVKTVIIGHSERRIIYKEDNDLINKKVKTALKNNFEVILCVGETLEEREKGEAEKVVGIQIDNCLAGITEQDLNVITIAYEPVWAIGTGKTATPADADAIHSFIRKRISKLYNNAASEKIIIQYGGSVKSDNIKELMKMPNLDGALVGGAALDANSFITIAEYYK